MGDYCGTWKDNMCKHEVTKMTKKMTCKGVVRYRLQCQHCGKPIGAYVARRKVTRYFEVEPFDEVLRQEAPRRVFFQWYNKYLKTEVWAKRRRAVLDNANNICEVCGVATATQAHHVTYQRVGDEIDGDLVALCKDCHKAHHGLSVLR